MNYIPVNTILYDLSLSMNPDNWNESAALEWAIQASRKIGGHKSFAQRQVFYEYDNYQLTKPEDYKTLIQIFYYLPSQTSSASQNATLLEYVKRVTDSPNPESLSKTAANADLANPWKTMHLSTSSFITPCKRSGNKKCAYEFIEQPTHFMMPVKSGIVSINYLGYNVKDGEFLIPDTPSYREAILSYIMYRLYDSKVNADSKDQSLQQQRMWYLTRFGFLVTKAKGEVNAPTVNELENLLQNRNKLIPRSDQFETGFTNLNKPQNNPNLF
jgi:hypothetical protein